MAMIAAENAVGGLLQDFLQLGNEGMIAEEGPAYDAAIEWMLQLPEQNVRFGCF